MGVTQQMAEYISRLSYEKLPSPVIEHCKVLILDALGCGVRGSQTDIGKITFEFAKQLGSDPQSTIWGRRLKIASPAAAYVNASSVNALDYDDTGKGGHPGSTVIPAAVALAEKIGKGGRDLILAVVAGYELELALPRRSSLPGSATSRFMGSEQPRPLDPWQPLPNCWAWIWSRP